MDKPKTLQIQSLPPHLRSPLLYSKFSARSPVRRNELALDKPTAGGQRPAGLLSDVRNGWEPDFSVEEVKESDWESSAKVVVVPLRNDRQVEVCYSTKGNSLESIIYTLQ